MPCCITFKLRRDVSTIGGKERPGLVHRLDKETSGVMVIAKTDVAHRHLAATIQTTHHYSRIRSACLGRTKERPRAIELAIGRDSKERKEVLGPYGSTERLGDRIQGRSPIRQNCGTCASLPETGRTHQLRVHLASLGHPILGDPTYGGRKVCSVNGVEVPRVMLHARTLGFRHPVTGEVCEYERPAPCDMERLMREFEHGVDLRRMTDA